MGKEHPYTLWAMHNLAEVYRNQGNYEEAEPLAAKTLEIRSRILSQKNPETLNTMKILADIYKKQDRYEEAEPLFVELVEISQGLLIEGHPGTVASMNELIQLYEAWGKRCLDFRTRHKSHNVHDLFYTDLVEDPMAAIRGIYDHFHMEWPPEMEGNLKDFIDRKHGANRPQKRKYTLEQYGLTAGDVDRAFEDYHSYFSLKSE